MRDATTVTVAPPFDFEAAKKALNLRAASAALPREHTPVPEVSKPGPKVTGEFTPATRRGILERDQRQCVRCGRHVKDDWLGYSLQHRLARGMGGTSDPIIGLPSNGIVLCGSATTGCHGWVEQDTTGEAELLGYAVASWALPSSVPVLYFPGIDGAAGPVWVKLSDVGGKPFLVKPPPRGNAHAVAERRP